MAINDGINGGYPGDLFGVPLPRPEHPETVPGIQANDTTGPVIATPVVSAVSVSTQTSVLPTATVYAGDTSGQADDLAAHGDTKLMAVPTEALSDTGAGRGQTAMRHPNSVSGK
jgi:hypothetical protein